MQQHSFGLLGSSLQFAIGLTNVSWLNGSAPLLGRVEQAGLALSFLHVLTGFGASTTVLLVVFALLDFKCLLGQSLDDLEGKESEDVNNVIVWLGFGHDSEACPLAESLALAVGEGSLATLGPEYILLPCHVAGTFISGGKTLEGRVVLFLLFFILFIFTLGDLDGVETVDIPRKSDFGALVLGLGGHVCGACNNTSCIVGGSKVGGVTTTLVVGILDVLADVLPGQEGSQTGDLSLVVANQED